jgi:hypothetical protein
MRFGEQVLQSCLSPSARIVARQGPGLRALPGGSFGCSGGLGPC